MKSIDEMSEEEAFAALLIKKRRERKRARDRLYWRKHRAKLNKQRRSRYAVDSEVLKGIEKGDDE